jgi:hypothetical protein
MHVGVNASQCRAAGLAEVTFGVALEGMTAAPRSGAYLAGGGPPGGALWFAVLPAWGQGAASLEPTLLSLLPAEDRSVALCNAPLAGSLRPCLVAAAGQHLGRVVALAALVVDPRACPQGMIVVAACDGRHVNHPTLDAVLGCDALRTLCESLTLGEAREAALAETEAVLTLNGPQGTSQHPLRTPRVLLGRSQGADVVLFDARVSRRHCVLERRGEGWVLVVLGTAQGVTVHGALRAQGEYLLGHGEVFELGETTARLTVNPGRAEASPWQRVPALEARFASWSLPPPKIPHGITLAEIPHGVGPPAWASENDPRLSLSWREGEGLEGVRVEFHARAWSIVLEGGSLGTTLAHAHLGSVWRALGAALCDAVASEGSMSPAARVAVVARSPADATWTSPFGQTYASPSGLDALLDALAARRSLTR